MPVTDYSKAAAAAAAPPPTFDLHSKLTNRLTSQRRELSSHQQALHTQTTHLSNLVKSSPKKPRDTKSTLSSRVSTLEKQRSLSSVSLSKEKQIVRDIQNAQRQLRLHEEYEQHQLTIYNKRQEIEVTKKLMGGLNENIIEITKVLETVELASRLNCTPKDIITKEVICSVQKLNGVLDDLHSFTNVLSNQTERGIQITIDKLHGKFVIRGKNSSVVSDAISEINNVMNKIVYEWKLNNGDDDDDTLCLYLQQPSVLDEWKRKCREEYGVRLELLTRLNKVVLTGSAENIEGAKRDIEKMDVTTKLYEGLDGKQVAIVIGKHGGRIHELSSKYGVVMNVIKDNSGGGKKKKKEEQGGEENTSTEEAITAAATTTTTTTSSLKIIGPAVEADMALSAVKTLLYDNELIQESYDIEPIMKSELMKNGGVCIKEFESSISSAVNAAVYLNVERSSSLLLTNKDNDNAATATAAPAATATSTTTTTPRPTLITKCPRFVTDRVKKLVVKKIAEFESNIVTLTVPSQIIPAIIGKKGSKIDSLQQLGASIDVDSTTGIVKIYSHKEEKRIAVKHAIEQIIHENQIGHVDIDKKILGVLFGDTGKEIMSRMNTELSCNVSVNEDDTRLIVKGSQENIDKSIELLNAFMEKNQVLEVEICDEDAGLLFASRGGDKSLLHTVESKYGVHGTYRSDREVLVLRGEMEKVEAAKKVIDKFLYGGEGITVVKFKVAEDAIGGIVGKGGSNLTKLEKDFEGVIIYIPKNQNTVSLRGPKEMVEKCRTQLVTDMVTNRILDSIDLTPKQQKDLSSNANVIKRIAGPTNTSIVLNGGSIKIRGVSRDVRDAKALLHEHFTGSYSGYIDLDKSQYDTLKSTLSNDNSHLERIRTSTGANPILDDSNSVIKITGKRTSVKHAKDSVIGFLDFLFPNQIQTVKVDKTLFKSMSDPEKLAPITVATGALVYPDRDLMSVVIVCESSENAAKAVEMINERLAESEKLNYVLRLEPTDDWLLPAIIGKGGKNIKKIETDSACTVNIIREDLTIAVQANSQEALDAGKAAFEAIIDKARKECIFLELPEAAISAFIGRGGSNIKQLRSNHNVEIEKSKKNQSIIKVTGEEEAVTNAKEAVLSWLNDWQASHVGLTIDIEEQYIPSIIGKGGETIRTIQKDTKCKIDIDRNSYTLTVREGTESARQDALDSVKAIIEEEKAKSADQSAENEKLRKEQQELFHSKGTTPETSLSCASLSSKSTKEVLTAKARPPVGWAAMVANGHLAKAGTNRHVATSETNDYVTKTTIIESRIENDRNTENECAGSEDGDTSTISSNAPSSMSVPISTTFETLNATGEKQLNYRTKSGFSIRI